MHYFISDLISYFKIPTILVARSKIGTINHTLLSLEYMRQRNIEILGVILSGKINPRNKESIERYGMIEVLAELPFVENICFESLKHIPLSLKLKQLFKMTE